MGGAGVDLAVRCVAGAPSRERGRTPHRSEALRGRKLTALLLGLVGAADALRTHLGLRSAAIAIVVLAVASAAGFGAPVIGVVVVILAALRLPVATTEAGRRPPGGLRDVVDPAAAVLVLTLIDRAGAASEGPLVDAWSRFDGTASGRPLEQVLLAAGAGLLLLESCTVIVRAALHRRSAPHPEPRRSPSLRARLLRPPAEIAPFPDLRGGRAIGPRERVLVAGSP